jgi:hypothetical protein
MRLFSYVVRYDSGFAPNPFYGWCTLATCKPPIRRSAQVGDWIVGTGSDNQQVRRGGHLVYAMRVTDILSFREYDADARFQAKKPFRSGSRKQSCGDNIYYRDAADERWLQRDSFHTAADGSPQASHIARDTGVDRVLASDKFIYFGGEGPRISSRLKAKDGRPLAKSHMGYYVFDDEDFIKKVEAWVCSVGDPGYQGPPFEWITLRG